MNFELRSILTALAGNNASQRSVSVRVMNEVAPTAQQMNALANRYDLFKMNARLSLAGFLTVDGTLADGSAYRVVSNSGMDTVMLWPASAVQAPVLQQLFHIFCIPAQYDVQYGWTTPPVLGSNGTPAPLQDANAGALFGLKHDDATDKLLGEQFVRYQKVEVPLSKNVSFFATNAAANNTSAQQWDYREWWSADRKNLVQVHDSVRVNGVSYGNPVFRTLWACIYKFDEGDGSGPTPHVLAIGINTNQLQLLRTKLGTAAWTTLSTFSIGSLDAAATNAADRFDWVRKIEHNASQTVVSLWVQNPNAEALGTSTTVPPPAFFVGTVDFDMATGAFIGSTPAEGEVRRSLRIDSTYQLSTSGKRQISFHYDGDTKAYTELHFAGSRGEVVVLATSSSSYSYSSTLTDDRTVRLVRGTDFDELIAWAEVVHGVHTESGTAPGTGGGTGTSDYATNFHVNYHLCNLLYYGGRGDVFAILEREIHMNQDSASGGLHSGTVNPPPFTSSWSHTVTTTVDTTVDTRYTRHTAKVLIGDSIVPGGETHLAGERIKPGTLSTTTTNVTSQWGNSGFIGTIDSNPSGTKRWGSASIQDVLGPSSDGTEKPYAFASQMVTMGTGFPTFAAQEAVDTSYFNGRVVDDFVVFSVPQLGTYTPGTDPVGFDPTKFVTYCTDSAILEKINVDAVQGVLKGICIK